MVENDEPTSRPVTFDPETTWEVTQVFPIDGNNEPELPQVISLIKDQTDVQPIPKDEMIAEQAEDVVYDRYREHSKQPYSPFKFKEKFVNPNLPSGRRRTNSRPRVFAGKSFLPLSLPAPSRASQGIKDVRLHETELLLVSNSE